MASLQSRIEQLEHDVAELQSSIGAAFQKLRGDGPHEQAVKNAPRKAVTK